MGLVWPVAGLLGSTLTAAAASDVLDGRPIRWWWRAPLPGGHSLQLNLLWVGVALLCAAWVGLGRRLATGASARDIALIGALWAAPLALGPALFSHDLFSYLAQGSILHHGLDPYRMAPARALPRLHELRLLATVSPSWRATTAPYGPAFLALAGLAAAAAGPHLALAVELMRLPALAGLALLAWGVPVLARRLGADPARATWLVVASPLALLYFAGSGHNDVLMAGLCVVGVALALCDRPLLGFAVCVAAALVKLPAAVAAIAILIAWARALPAGRPRAFALARAGAIGAVLVLAVGVLSGAGLRWLSGGALGSATAARIALTPATALAVTLHELGHGVHSGVEQAAAGLEQASARIALGLVAALAVWLLWRVRRERLVRSLGLLLLAAALGGPEAWPWYLIWGAALLAADPAAQRSPWLAVSMLVPAFLITPAGDVAVPLPHAFELVVAYAAAMAFAVWVAVRRRTQVTA